MSLVKAERPATLAAAVEQWESRDVSRISDHGAACCESARAWLAALDRSRRASGSRISGPKWILEAFPWGPSDWPLHWCELVQTEKLDCGALADLTRTLFAARGVKCKPVQVIQQFSTSDVEHWIATWHEASRAVDWIVGPFTYHEACAVFVDEQNIRVWDPTDNCWIIPGGQRGYGNPVAMRLLSPTYDAARPLSWEGKVIERNVWQVFT